MLTSPLFQARWRWNLNTSLTILRMRGGRKNPPAIQRMEADDLMAAVFPTLAACQENVAPGPMEIPDHPLVRQTLEDCLHEAMDIDGLRELVAGIEAGRITVITRDTTEPSVLAHEILNGQPFTYLDEETEAGNRRSRQVKIPRGLPVEARDLARLDPDAIERVAEQVRPQPRDADELHDLLMTVFVMRPRTRLGHVVRRAERRGPGRRSSNAGGRSDVVRGRTPGRADAAVRRTCRSRREPRKPGSWSGDGRGRAAPRPPGDPWPGHRRGAGARHRAG